MAEQGRAKGRTQGYAGTWPPRDAARAGGIAPSGLSAWPSLIDKLRTWIRAEAGAGQLLPWVPVAFGTGIALYFTADREPVLPAVAWAGEGTGKQWVAFHTLPKTARVRSGSKRTEP